MKKELKDYLHLYLGCDVYIFPLVTVTDGWLKSYLEKYPTGQFKIDMSSKELDRILKDGYLPILRPLSDKTDEEKEWLEEHEDFVDKYKKNAEEQLIIEWDAEKTRYLLSKYFDLFGLIEAGLVIDKTKIDVPTN